MIRSKILVFSLMLLLIAAVGSAAAALSPIERLGQKIFFDQNLSANSNQACAACHGPRAGWTGPSSNINAGGAVYPGSFPDRFGNRKPPSAAYATLSPIFNMPTPGFFVGGNFWDGRATGEKLGNPAADQAQGPFLNPVEQALPDAAAVVGRICAGTYARMFLNVWGPDACNMATQADIDLAYNRVGWSIAAYEDSEAVNQFSARYDMYLFACVAAGNARADCASGNGTQAVLDPTNIFNARQWNGFQLFVAPNNNDGVLAAGEGGNCAACHVTTWTTRMVGVYQEDVPPAFTDFTYDNLGVPKNPLNPVYVTNPTFIDPGLAGFLTTRPEWTQYAAANEGKHKVPTMRNVTKAPNRNFVKAFSHNGYFKSLLSIVHFYNTRDVLAACSDPLAPTDQPGVNCWPAAEVGVNVNMTEMGNLGLSARQERDLVTFMSTLSDGPARRNPPPVFGLQEAAIE